MVRDAIGAGVGRETALHVGEAQVVFQEHS